MKMRIWGDLSDLWYWVWVEISTRVRIEEWAI